MMASAARHRQVPDSMQWLTFSVSADSLHTDTFRLRRVEGGVFVMGATPEQRSDRYSTDRPSHTVALSTYYIAETEVTNALWRAVMPDWRGFDGWYDPQLPVNYVSWNDCQLFLQRLDSLTGLPFRLPTEAEWEYAARGGAQSRGYRFAGSDDPDTIGWGLKNAGFRKHPVAQKMPNELGLYDMTGNVSEWCTDWYAPYYIGTEPNPQGPAEGEFRIIRGGSFDHCEDNRHISMRQYLRPEEANNYCGLRLALTLPEDTTALAEEVAEPELVRHVRIRRHRMKFLYVPAEQPYYIADEAISIGLWRRVMASEMEGRAWDDATGMTQEERLRCLDRCRTYAGLPLEIATEQDVDTAITLRILPPDTKAYRYNQVDTRKVQRKRRRNQKASMWTELVGWKLEVPDDPTLQTLDGKPEDQYPMRLIIRL